jgi:hypothetical protein
VLDTPIVTGKGPKTCPGGKTLLGENKNEGWMLREMDKNSFFPAELMLKSKEHPSKRIQIGFELLFPALRRSYEY